MYGSQEFFLGQQDNVRFFTVDPYSVSESHGLFSNWAKFRKNIFLKIKTSTIKSEKNIYQTIHNTRFIFNFFGIFTIFLYFSWFFEEKNIIFWKKYENILPPTQATRCNFGMVSQFSTHHWYLLMCRKLQNHSKVAPGGLCRWQHDFCP